MTNAVVGVKGFVKRDVYDRLDSYTSKSDGGCWIWTGSRDRNGYAILWIDGKQQRVTRWLLSEARGETLPVNIYACHRCDNPSCVRLDHLFEGSARDNSRDALAKGRLKLDGRLIAVARYKARTHCKRGHLLSGPNLRVDTYGRRRCRECQNINRTAYDVRARAALAPEAR